MGVYHKGSTVCFLLEVVNEFSRLNVDADALPTCKVYTAAGSLVGTATVTHPALGDYRGHWTASVDVGSYKYLWEFDYNAKPYKKEGYVTVIE